VSIESRRDFLLVKEKTHAAIRAGILDWRDRRTPFPDRARSGELGGPPWVTQTGKHLAGFSRVCSHALHFERACDR
jgi:hypothetical protein